MSCSKETERTHNWNLCRRAAALNNLGLDYDANLRYQTTLDENENLQWEEPPSNGRLAPNSADGTDPLDPHEVQLGHV